jgi:hypothetical protein
VLHYNLTTSTKQVFFSSPGLITSRQIDYDLSIMGAVARSLIPSDTPYGKREPYFPSRFVRTALTYRQDRNTAFFLKKDFDDAKATMQTLTVGTPEYSEYVAQRQKITADVRDVCDNDTDGGDCSDATALAREAVHDLARLAPKRA